MNSLLDYISDTDAYRQIVRRIADGWPQQSVCGISGTQKAYLLAALSRSLSGRPMVVVTYSQYEADRLFERLSCFIDESAIGVFPAYDILPHHELLRSLDVAADRMTVIRAAMAGALPITVIPAKALVRKILDKRDLLSASLLVRVGDVFEHEQIASRLVYLGYRRSDVVENKGEFCVRGGIVDVFPIADEEPIRIEFFDDEVESIRRFDPETQRSEGQINEVFLYPASEFVYQRDEGEAAAERIKRELAHTVDRLRKMERGAQAERLEEQVKEHIAAIEQGTEPDLAEEYASHFERSMASILSYFDNPLVVLDEPIRVADAIDGISKEIRSSYVTMIEQGKILPSQSEVYFAPELVSEEFERYQCLNLALLSRGLPSKHQRGRCELAFKSPPAYQGSLDKIIADLKAWKQNRKRVLVVVNTKERGNRLVDLFREREVESAYSEDLRDSLVRGAVVVTSSDLDGGFIFDDAHLVVLTETEIQGRKRARRRFRFDDEAAKITSYTDLKAGDLVVHVAHGIGRYVGVETLEIAGTKRDYLLVRYAGDDKLYVPTDQVDLLQKYIGVEGAVPKLNKMGGTEWSRTKARARKSVQDLADGLLQLYAAREAIQGHAFSPDTVWQDEFEEAFEHDETPDQLRVIEEVKRDMESSRPMDRLICGAVGYGKTEIAIRAAFKCIMDEKQVAVLVPTTILAQQHYTTFSERFTGYPVNIAVLSRFQTRKEQADIIRGLKNGKVDIVIGTHRLLQKDIRFKDLGLLVIDEEQRFGVAHKERLKEMKKTVDVLTLTATPIPRTLHMAMVGVRDMSVINTPPRDRFPVRTFVVEHDPNLIREVILREIDRGGQVYYVYNRVEDIDAVAAYLIGLIPEARFGVAHGQMTESRLERTMMRFLQREFDVLVCTTIIESGLDIANVNTILIDHADKLGLAQLYQLRGRVGRSNRVAYCYLMYRKDRMLSEVAEKRLEAIREFSELGSGFKIAMRDLEIRGAGNILGPEQHGNIAAVGFEMYCKLLEEAVKERRGALKRQQLPDPTIELAVDAYIPDYYVSDPGVKIEVYKRINSIKTVDDADDVENELRDRFGNIPEAVQCLVGIARIKVYARALGVAAIVQQGNQVTIRLHAGLEFSANSIMEIAHKYRRRLIFNVGRKPSMRVKVDGLEPIAQVQLITDVLEDVADALNIRVKPQLVFQS